MSRLFFGIETISPWPEELPQGRLLTPENRHLTLAFLGEADQERLLSLIDSVPKPNFKIGFVGHFKACLMLPPRHPNVAAWHIKFWEGEELINSYQKELTAWLKKNDFPVKEHDRFLPHVTICRKPFDANAWQKNFQPLPLMMTNIHLYESLGQSNYRSIWQMPILPPFKETSHTADIAFDIYGQNFDQLYLHATAALAFHFPPLITFFPMQKIESLDCIVMQLNESVALADSQIGCPFKAISYHDQTEHLDDVMKWEMIVDV